MKTLLSTNALSRDIFAIRQQSPLIHCITNFVTMQIMANILLALHASPIMSHAREEIQEMIKISNALLINIGTLDPYWFEAMKDAQHYAEKIPIILDPVGCGATAYRTKATRELLKEGVDIIRGNASEIMALTQQVRSKGVDSQHSSKDAVQAAREISTQYHCTVVVSGERDIIVYQNKMATIAMSTPVLQNITGMGCAVTAVLGAFAAVNKNYFLAASHGMAAFAIASKKASARSMSPGSFVTHLLDCLFEINTDDLTGLLQEATNYEVC